MDIQVKYIGGMDFSGLYFAPVETVKSRKSVNVYLNNRNTTWSNRIAFQLSENEETPLIAKYGIDTADEGHEGDPYRRNVTALLDPTTHKTTIDKLMDIDKIVKAEALKKCKEWWKKDLEESAVNFKYKPLVIWDEVKQVYSVKFKVIVDPPNREPGKKYSKPTVIYKISDNNDAIQSDSSILTSGSEITPQVSAVQVWFMGENQFGISLKADVLLVKPKLVPSPLETMQTKRKFNEISEMPTSTDDALKSAKVEDELPVVLEDGDSAM
jgi:hypothetical protein